MGGVHDDAVAIAPEITELRRAIHADPEIGTDLPRTQEKVLAALDRPLEITRSQSLTSVTAVLRAVAAPGLVRQTAVLPTAVLPTAGARSCCCAATWTPCR